MIRRPPRATRTDTLFPYTTLFRSFAGVRFLKQNDKGLALATIQAYNDWHVQDWCGPYPGRMIPLALLPLWDIDLTLAEMKRMIALGVHSCSFPDNPAMIGLPSLHDEQCRPVWEQIGRASGRERVCMSV